MCGVVTTPRSATLANSSVVTTPFSATLATSSQTVVTTPHSATLATSSQTSSDYSILGNAGSFVTNSSDYFTLGNAGNIVTNVTDPSTLSQNNQHDLPPWEGDDNLVSPQQRDLATLVLKCGLQNAVMFIGIPANALNLAVFAKVRDGGYGNWTRLQAACWPVGSKRGWRKRRMGIW